MFKSTESRKKLYIVVLRLGIAFALLTSLFGFIVSMAAGETWSPLGDGTGADVYALAFNRSGNVYAGGNFTSAGSLVANSIAKWDGSAWSLLGSGLNNTVYALAVDGSGNLYAGGTFTTAGGVAANRVAKWDGSAWSPLGSGMNAEVYALVVDPNGTLYAGGNFTTAGGVTANRVAKWDGSAWLPLGAGTGGRVNALAFDSFGNLYAGGSFTTPAGRIARWDGAAWVSLGGGVSSTVRALAADGSGNLYAGGSFATASGVTVNHIAKWKGAAWSALGSGGNADVYALAVSGGGKVYAGGDFTSSGNLTLNRVAEWNGSEWSALESGMNEIVHALAFDGNGALYAGGGFTSAGSVSANRLARWAAPASGSDPTPTPTTLPTSIPTPPVNSATGITTATESPLFCTGESTTVSISLAEVTDLFGYQFIVHYDPGLVNVSAAFDNTFFNTSVNASVPSGWDASCSNGTCKFAASKIEPGAPVTGSGPVAQLILSGVNAGTFDLTITDSILSDRDARGMAHNPGSLHLTVCGYANVSGTVLLQGRETPVNAGQVTLTDPSNTFGPYMTSFNPTTGAFTIGNVRVLPGGSNYQLDAAHGLYLGSRTTHTLQPLDNYSAPDTRLLGGDANNDGLIDLSDLTCIGGSFGGTPVPCGTTGSSDINADGTVNILDLVLAGSNYELTSPRIW